MPLAIQKRDLVLNTKPKHLFIPFYVTLSWLLITQIRPSKRGVDGSQIDL
jgi:hypothetical protein